MRYAARDEVFLPSPHPNPLSANDQRIATLYHQHVFIVVMDMLGRGRILSTDPERHLTSINSIEDVALNSRSSLTRGGNLVGRMFHEFRKVVHIATHCRRTLRTWPPTCTAFAHGGVEAPSLRTNLVNRLRTAIQSYPSCCRMEASRVLAIGVTETTLGPAFKITTTRFAKANKIIVSPRPKETSPTASGPVRR